jgi:predicted DNA-binding transcriptional regulator YafY
MHKSTILLVLYNELKKGPLDIKQIEKLAKIHQWNTSKRTLYRYMESLSSNIYFPNTEITVTMLENGKKEWRIKTKGHYHQENITEDDIIAFFLLKNYIPHSISANREFFINKFFEWSWQKLSNKNTHYIINNEQDCFYNTNFAETVYSVEEQNTLKIIIDAIQQRLSLKVNFKYDYTSLPKNHESPLTIFPLKIVLHRGTLHVSYQIKGDNSLYLLAIDQINSCEKSDKFLKSETSDIFELQFENMFGITNNVDGKIYHIELEISGMLAEFIKRRTWHPSQKLTILADGNYLLTLKCGINRELVGWIFSWMTNIKVLQPPELVIIMKRKITELQKIYANEITLEANNSFK